MKLHNFNSGPSILPQPVLEEASKAIIDFNGTGLSILEIGHRTAWFQEVLQEAISSVKKLMQLNDNYEVLFLHGGATTQFMQVPMNLLDTEDTAAYCDNGIWGSKAAKEAAAHTVTEVAQPAVAVVLEADHGIDQLAVAHAEVHAAHAVPASAALASARTQVTALVAPQVIDRPLPADVDLLAQVALVAVGGADHPVVARAPAPADRGAL